MDIKEVKEKNQMNNPKEDEKSGEKINESADAEAKKESIKNTNEKESEMTDKKEVKEQGHEEKDSETVIPTEDQFAPGVTPEPQNDEQLDLNLMKDPVAVSKISVPTDDDEGEFLDDTETVKELREFINVHNSEKGDGLRDAELLKIGTEIISNFNKKLSLKEALTLAVLTKYRILFGMGLDIVYEVVKETGQNWKYFYKDNFIPSTYSSSDKYRKLSRIPNIIRYAFLGLERLEKINTAIKDDYDMEGPDPIGKFFSDSSISIDFHECGLENFREEIDAAVTKIRINNFFKAMNKGVPDDKIVKNTVEADLIDNFISEGKKIEGKLMGDLYLYAKDGANPNTILKESLKGGNRKTLESINNDLTATKTIEGFPKLISELRSKVTYLSNHTALIKKITPQHVKDLQAQVNALKELIKAQNTAK